MGMQTDRVDRYLLLGLLFGLQWGAAVPALAQTPEEDEARIEALMGSPIAHVSAGVAAAVVPKVDDSINETPIAAAVVAPAPSENDSWLAAPQQDEGLEFSALPKLAGQRVAVIMAQDKERVGTIVTADAKQVTLKITRKGGSASYSIPREKILRVEAR